VVWLLRRLSRRPPEVEVGGAPDTEPAGGY
jgi:hypothetical protein